MICSLIEAVHTGKEKHNVHGAISVMRKLSIASVLAATAIGIRGSLGILAAFDGIPDCHQAVMRLSGLVGGMV